MVASSRERSVLQRAVDSFTQTFVLVVFASFVVLVSLIALLPLAGTVAARRV